MDASHTSGLKRLQDRSLARLGLSLILAALVLLLSGCALDDPEDESGVAGTGIYFRGAVSEQKALASRIMDIRSQSGDRSAVVIEENGQYQVQSLSGSGPWLLRIDLGNGDYRFGIAYEAGIANVHSYSDITIRSWFIQQYGVNDLNTAFESEGALEALPDVSVFASLAAPYLGIVRYVLEDYALDGAQLFNEDFRNNDSGVDRFLDLNPAIVSGDKITFVKTDFLNTFNTSITTGFLSGEEAVQADITSPSIPSELRVFSQSTDSVLLVWEPSTDDTAVIGYEIVRNGELAGISAYPVYTDKPLQSETPYLYEIRSIDLAGNRSEAAVISSLGPSPVVNSIAPSAPTQLTSLLASTQRVELSWGQSAINEVAGFNVYRGTTPDDMLLLIRTTSTTLTDATTSAGLNYCYQVTAVNASGFESEPTESLCVLTTGIVIDTPTRPVATVLPLAGLTIPDVDSVACDTGFPDYTLNEPLTVVAGCYQVSRDIVVEQFGMLTLQAGVILKFAQDTELLVNSLGALQVQGIPSQPVVLTGERAVPGWWRGITIDRSDDQRNIISHAVIEYTGGDSTTAGVSLVSSTNAISRLRLENSLIRFGDNYGVAIPGLDSRMASFRGNLITQNDRAAFVNHTALASINDGSDFIDNDLQIIFVPFTNYDTDIVISDPGLPIQSGGIIQDRNTIIITEGVRLNFPDGAVFRAKSNLAIRGTPENPVVLSSSRPGAGSWLGLQLTEGANAELNHLIIENAGQPGDLNPEGANLYADDARLSAENLTLRNSASYGFFSAGRGIIVDKADGISSVNNAREDVVQLEVN